MDKKLNDFLPDASGPDQQFLAVGMHELCDYTLLDSTDIRSLLHLRKPFSHKGTYGHALLIAGGTLTMGAALLASKGCLYAGAGLTTAAIPSGGLIALNSALPEVMYVEKEQLLAESNSNQYNAIAIGPGIDDGEDNLRLLDHLISAKRQLIVDADGLNLLSNHHKLLSGLTADSILTPHVKEFDRLFGPHETWWDRLQTARKEALNRKLVIVLKNQFTFIVDQEGRVYINSTGNPAMAQGGMGDVLTGIIAAYVAQGYVAKEAAILACYLHGKSGDTLAETHFNVTASQVAKAVPVILKSLISG
jgi:ADP-dependent NAD(P)H-hydrate dehydratase